MFIVIKNITLLSKNREYIIMTVFIGMRLCQALDLSSDSPYWNDWISDS